MRFTIATIAAMAASASASAIVIPRVDYGAYNVSYVQTGGADRGHSEHVYGVYTNAELKDNIEVDCLSQTWSDGTSSAENDPTVLTCSPPSFTYKLKDSILTLTQIVKIDGEDTVIRGTSGPLETKLNPITGKGESAHNVTFQAVRAIAPAF